MFFCTTTLLYARTSRGPAIYSSHKPWYGAQRRKLFLLMTAGLVHADEEGAGGAAFSHCLTDQHGLLRGCMFSLLCFVSLPRRHGGCAAQRPCLSVWTVYRNKTLKQPVDAAARCGLLHLRQWGNFVSRPCLEPVFCSFLFSGSFLFLFRCFSMSTSFCLGRSTCLFFIRFFPR